MRLGASLPRLPLFALLSLPSACLGCGGEPERPLLALHRAFPDHAAEVVEGSAPFEIGGEGFTRSSPAGSSSGIEVTLPRDSAGVIRFHLPGGVEVRVRELDVAGEGTLAGQAVSYLRLGGASFWTAVPGGVEEWLLLDAGAARADAIVATWEVQGASPRERGGAVFLVDEAGAARMRVTAPKAYQASGREVEARLSVRGARIELSVDAGGEAVLVDPVWTATTEKMSIGRIVHTATLLKDGAVLVAGGESASGGSKSAELYIPASQTWQSAGVLNAARTNHTATLLRSGKVLAAGGDDAIASFFNTAEVYDPAAPATAPWTPVASMSTVRSSHTATLLQDGQVLVVGGSSQGGFEKTAERYDPVTEAWTNAASMQIARANHAATLLQNGKVLVTGGRSNATTVEKTAELYNPANDAWTPVESMSAARVYHTATQIPSGKVLVIGGSIDGVANPLSSVELYDPATGAFSAGPPMSGPRFLHTATLLGNGAVLVAGGKDASGKPLSTAEIYDPEANAWTTTASLTTGARFQHTATRLKSGAVLVAGGFDGFNFLDSAELFTLDCASSPQPDNALCDDGNLCTVGERCQGGLCQPGTPITCADPSVCEKAVCNADLGACVPAQKLDGAPCPGGVCIAGGCLADSSPAAGGGSGGASGSGNGGASSSSATVGAGTTASAGGSGAASSSSVTSASSGGGGSSDIRLHGGCGTSRAPASAAPWLLLGLLLAARQKRAQSSRGIIARSKGDT